jgi:hypothetical protein
VESSGFASLKGYFDLSTSQLLAGQILMEPSSTGLQIFVPAASHDPCNRQVDIPKVNVRAIACDTEGADGKSRILARLIVHHFNAPTTAPETGKQNLNEDSERQHFLVLERL